MACEFCAKHAKSELRERRGEPVRRTGGCGPSSMGTMTHQRRPHRDFNGSSEKETRRPGDGPALSVFAFGFGPIRISTVCEWQEAAITNTKRPARRCFLLQLVCCSPVCCGWVLVPGRQVGKKDATWQPPTRTTLAWDHRSDGVAGPCFCLPPAPCWAGGPEAVDGEPISRFPFAPNLSDLPSPTLDTP